MMYEVIVGNIGTVLQTKNKQEAQRKANEYIRLSQQNYGRAAGESVTVLNEYGDIVREYIGSMDKEQES